MTARLIDGKAIAADLRTRVAADVRRLAHDHGLVPGIAVVLVGERSGERSLCAQQGKSGGRGRHAIVRPSPAGLRRRGRAAGPGRTSQRRSGRPWHSGAASVAARRSMPARSSRRSTPPRTSTAFIRSMPGGSRSACRPWYRARARACVILAKTVRPSLAGLDAVVIGRSNIVGKPLAQLLIGESATVTVAHSKTRDLPAVCRTQGFVVRRGRAPRTGQGRLDQAGRDRHRRRHQSDCGGGRQGPNRGRCRVRRRRARSRAPITPVPGGVGPMTIACLLVNTVLAACAAKGLPAPAL